MDLFDTIVFVGLLAGVYYLGCNRGNKGKCGCRGRSRGAMMATGAGAASGSGCSSRVYGASRTFAAGGARNQGWGQGNAY